MVSFERSNSVKADTSSKMMKVLLCVLLFMQVLEYGVSAPSTADEFLAQQGPSCEIAEEDFTPGFGFHIFQELEKFCKEEQRQGKIDKRCRAFKSKNCYCCGGYKKYFIQGNICRRFCRSDEDAVDKMPCKLEEDYSEYDDPDDFFPETPTRVPWFSINCGTQNSTSDDEDDKNLDQEGGDLPDEILGENKGSSDQEKDTESTVSQEQHEENTSTRKTNSQCVTLPGDTKGSGKPCVFPFILKNVTYDGCTTKDDNEGNYWCSTQTNRTNHHVGGGKGNWGHCPDDCRKANIGNEDTESTVSQEQPEDNTSTRETNSQCVTLPGNTSKGSGKPCVFPFILKNVTYDGCTTKDDNEGNYWCSTQTNRTNHHVGGGKGNWGHCPDDCRKANIRNEES